MGGLGLEFRGLGVQKHYEGSGFGGVFQALLELFGAVGLSA